MAELTETDLGGPGASERAGDDMHIHKPKAAHGLREFLSEIGVIVVGVLIAICAEQTVEWLHWREVVSVERKGLDAEMSGDWDAIHARVDMQPCVDDRLSEIAILFRRHDAGQPLGQTGPVGRPMYSVGSRAAWQMAVADQSLAHMEPEVRAQYASAISNYDGFTGLTAEERAAWRTLQQLNHPATLSPTAWDELHKAYDEALDANAVLKRLGADASGELTVFQGFGLPKHPTSYRGIGAVKDLCKSMLNP